MLFRSYDLGSASSPLVAQRSRYRTFQFTRTSREETSTRAIASGSVKRERAARAAAAPYLTVYRGPQDERGREEGRINR